MLTCIRHTTVLALGFVLFILVLSTCGGGPSEAEIEATVVARIEKKQAEDDALEAKAQAMAKAMVEATAEAAPTATPVPPAPTATAVPPTPITSLGEQLDYGNNTLYYLPSVTEQEAQTLFDYMVQKEGFNSESFIDLQLRKEMGVYEVRLSLREGIDFTDTDISDGLKQSACELEAYVFTGSAVHWIVVENAVAARDVFENILNRSMCLTPITSLGEQLDYGANMLYYLPSVTEQEAQNLLDYLVFQEFFTSESFNDVQFRKEGGIYEVRAPLREGMDLNDIDISYIIKQAACELEAYVFTGSAVHWVVVGDTFDDILKRYLCF